MAGGRKPSFAVQALPFMAMMALGSWGLSQFLKLPTQVKDDRMRRKRHGLAKFDLEKEHEVCCSHPADDACPALTLASRVPVTHRAGAPSATAGTG
jgi:hypothetical protein